MYSIESKQFHHIFSGVTPVVLEMGNIDNDSEPEFVLADGFLYDFGKERLQIPGILGEVFKFADLIGGPEDELVSISYSGECCEVTSLLIDVYDAQSLALLDSHIVEVNYMPDLTTHDLKFSKPFAEEKDQLFVLQYFDKELQHFVLIESGFQQERVVSDVAAIWSLAFVNEGLIVDHEKYIDSEGIVELLEFPPRLTDNVALVNTEEGGVIYAEVDQQLSLLQFDQDVLSAVTSLGVDIREW